MLKILRNNRMRAIASNYKCVCVCVARFRVCFVLHFVEGQRHMEGVQTNFRIDRIAIKRIARRILNRGG